VRQSGERGGGGSFRAVEIQCQILNTQAVWEDKRVQRRKRTVGKDAGRKGPPPRIHRLMLYELSKRHVVFVPG
jgi:hypothetical protein